MVLTPAVFSSSSSSFARSSHATLTGTDLSRDETSPGEFGDASTFYFASGRRSLDMPASQLSRRPLSIRRHRASFGQPMAAFRYDAAPFSLNSIMEEMPAIQGGSAAICAESTAQLSSGRRVITARRLMASYQNNHCINNNNNNINYRNVVERRRTIDSFTLNENELYDQSDFASHYALNGIHGMRGAVSSAPRRSPLKNVSAAYASSANIPQPLASSSNFQRVTAPAANQSLRQRVLTGEQEMAAQKLEEDRLNDYLLQRTFVPADIDKTVHLDERALAALLRAEKYAARGYTQFKALQNEIGEALRRTAVAHMYEVSSRENADLVVFPLAVSYMDRILSVQFVPRRNLGALADASLFLAMKMKAPQPPKAYHVVDGCKRRLEQLQDWEMFIVNKLEWNLSTATAFEFFDQLMVRAPILETLRENFANTLSAMLKDLQLAFLPASIQAAACLLYAADESRKTHLICESEAVVHKCFGIDASRCRFQYSTNIRFALGDFFFDDDAAAEAAAPMPEEVVVQESENVKNLNAKNAKRKSPIGEASRDVSFQTTLLCEESSLNDSFDAEHERHLIGFAEQVLADDEEEDRQQRAMNDYEEDVEEEMIIISEDELNLLDTSLEKEQRSENHRLPLSVREATQRRAFVDEFYKQLNPLKAMPRERTTPESDSLSPSFGILFHSPPGYSRKRPLSMPVFVSNAPLTTIFNAPMPKSATIAQIAYGTTPSFSESDDGIHTDENSNSSDAFVAHASGAPVTIAVSSKTVKRTVPGNDSGFSTSTVSTPESALPPTTKTTTTTTAAAVSGAITVPAVDSLPAVGVYKDSFRMFGRNNAISFFL